MAKQWTKQLQGSKRCLGRAWVPVAAGGVALAAVVLLAPAAVAVPPEVVFDDTFVDEFTIPAGEACDFDIVAHTDGRAIHRHYFNQQGEVVKHQTWVSGQDMATNPESGKTLEGNFSLSDFQREHDGELGPIEVHGLVFHFTVPGAGRVMIDAGRVVFDPESGDVLSVSGPHQNLEGDFEAFCAALS